MNITEREREGGMDFLVDFDPVLGISGAGCLYIMNQIDNSYSVLNRRDVYTQDCSHSLETNKRLQRFGFICKTAE